MSTRCWYADCDVVIPTTKRYVPLPSDPQDATTRMLEVEVRDDRALLEHLAQAHPAQSEPEPHHQFTLSQVH